MTAGLAPKAFFKLETPPGVLAISVSTAACARADTIFAGTPHRESGTATVSAPILRQTLFLRTITSCPPLSPSASRTPTKKYCAVESDADASSHDEDTWLSTHD